MHLWTLRWQRQWWLCDPLRNCETHYTSSLPIEFVWAGGFRNPKFQTITIKQQIWIRINRKPREFIVPCSGSTACTYKKKKMHKKRQVSQILGFPTKKFRYFLSTFSTFTTMRWLTLFGRSDGRPVVQNGYFGLFGQNELLNYGTQTNTHVQKYIVHTQYGDIHM